jgi:hypothetical protein
MRPTTADGAGQLSRPARRHRRGVRALSWTTTNGDTFVQANEVNTYGAVPQQERRPTTRRTRPTRSPTRVDPNVKNDRTREFIVGFDRQVARRWPSAAATSGASTISSLERSRQLDSANYRGGRLQATDLPGGRACEPVTYYEPTSQLPSANIYTNRPDRYRDFNGFELTFAKRMRAAGRRTPASLQQRG